MLRSLWIALALCCAASLASGQPTPDRIDRWVEMAPPARAEHSAVFDAPRERLLLFGGQMEGRVRNDVWALSTSGPALWQHLQLQGPLPPPRSGAAHVFDPTRNRLLIFGGCDSSGGSLGDLWELSLSDQPRWRQILPRGSKPRARWNASLTYDAEGKQIVLFGGRFSYNSFLSDVWSLSLKQPEWKQITPLGQRPVGRSAHSAIFCPDLHGVLVYGGEAYLPIAGCFDCRQVQETDDLWLLTLGDNIAWREVHPASGARPCESQGHVAAWDPENHRMLMFGGGKFFSPHCDVSGTLWSLSVPDFVWSRLALPEPWPRASCFPAMAFDPRSQRLLVHGGASTVTSFSVTDCMADTWQLSLAPTVAWKRISPERDAAIPRALGPAVYDSLRDRLLFDRGDRVWSYWPRSGEWSPVITAGDGPPAHVRGAMVLDTRRSRLIFYGGRITAYRSRDFLDVWALDVGLTPSTWSHVRTTGDAPPMDDACAIYDPIRDRLLVEGRDGKSAFPSGLWSLALGEGEPATWQQISSPLDTTAVRPMFLAGATAVYDSRRDRMVIFGGGVPTFDGWWFFNGCLAVNLEGPPVWEQLSPAMRDFDPPDPRLPRARAFASGTYDAGADRMIVIGGSRGVEDDAWALDLGSNSWTQLRMETDPHPAWVEAAAIYDTRRDKTWVLQGDYQWAIQSEAIDALPAIIERTREATRPNDLGLRLLRNDPTAKSPSVEFTLPDAAPATLKLFDVTGRCVWNRTLNSLGQGSHQLQLDALGEGAPGIFFLQLASKGVTRTTKVIRLR